MNLPPVPAGGTVPRDIKTQIERTIGLMDPTEVSSPSPDAQPTQVGAGANQATATATALSPTISYGSKTPNGSGSWRGSGYNPFATNLHSIDTEEAHDVVDERWLVSYADMMTLLFGLFVMLFSLSSQFRGDLNKAVQTISQKTFGAVQGGAYSGGTDIVPDEIEGLRTKLETTLAELSEYKAREDREKSKMTLDEAIKEKEEEIKRLRQELRSLRESAGGAALAAKLQKAEAHAEQLKSENTKLTKSLSEARSELNSKNGKGAGSFMALVIYWDSKNHDIDLIVEDPKGKKFDFKNRNFSKHPGTFTLDTRRGPGAEIWQTDRIIPGTYKVTYSFYSQYGNSDPATVQGTLSSVRGKKVLPAITLDFTNRRAQTLSFKVDEDGNINLLD